MLISEAFNLYRDNYIIAKNQSKRTAELHDACKRLFLLSVPDKPVELLSLSDIRHFREAISHGRRQNSIRVYVLRLRAVIGYLNLLDEPCIKAELIPVPQREATVPVYLTEQEVELMIQRAYNLRNAFIIALLYSSGIRLSELIALNRGQIVDRRFTVIGKGRKPRLCFIDARAEDLMHRYLETRQDHSSALIVSFEHKERMTATNIQLLVRNSAVRAGITKKVTPHTLRHSFATNFLKNNGNMRYLSAMLGHASLDTTMMYAHVVDPDLQAQYEKYHTI